MSAHFELREAFEILGRTPAVLDGLLRGTSPSWHEIQEDSDTWTAFDVVGHLIHAEETDWVPRARIILEHGEARPFDPFDRAAQLERSVGRTLDELIDRFAEVRRANLELVRQWELTETQLAIRGCHPSLGTVTLRQLLATWAVHDLNHVGQIVRVMSRRYEAEVGPWVPYLGILRRPV